jgi:hypothetical protein
VPGALLPDQGVLQRQLGEIDCRQLVDARLVRSYAGLVSIIDPDQVLALLVAIENVGPDPDFIETGYRRLRHSIDLRQVRQALGDVLADRGFLRQQRRRREGENDRHGDGDKRLVHGNAFRSRGPAR